MPISDPRNLRHVHHIGYDPNSGFEGVPAEWEPLLKSSGVLKGSINPDKRNPSQSQPRSPSQPKIASQKFALAAKDLSNVGGEASGQQKQNQDETGVSEKQIPKRVYDIAICQQAKGSWTFMNAAGFLGISTDYLEFKIYKIQRISFAKGDIGLEVWATAIVIFILETRFFDFKHEWDLLCLKGKKWINKTREKLEWGEIDLPESAKNIIQTL